MNKQEHNLLYKSRHREELCEKQKAYYLAHKEDRLAYHREYYRKNRELIIDNVKQYRLDNPDKKVALDRQYKLKNKEHLNAIKRRYMKTAKGKQIRRADNHRRRNNGGITVSVIQSVYEENIKKFGTLTCYLCFQKIIFGQDHLEHRIPLCRGGSHEHNNLAVSCPSCNLRKGKMTDDEYLAHKLNQHKNKE